MAKLDFPDASYSPWVAPNNVIYTYIGTSPNGYWEANTANAATNLTAVFVERTGSIMTGALKLDNAGSVSLPDISFDGDVNTGLYSPGADSLAITTAGTQRVVVDSSGNVGIGTTSPVSTGANYGSLDINGSDGGELYLSDSGTAKGNLFNYSADSNLIGLAAVNASGQLLFSTGGYNERLRIDSSGRVGIGTTSPDAKLSITGAYNQDGLKVLSGGASYQSPLIVGPASGGEYMRVDGSGNVGIGTATPLSKLNVKGTQGNWRVDPDSVSNEIQILSTNAANSGFLSFRLRANDTIFENGGSERMRIDSSGNVFIGGSTASSADIALNANGSASFKGTISASGQNTINEASALKFSQETNVKSQIRAYGPDASTNGSLEFKISPTSGTALTPLTLNSDGSATFAGGSFTIASDGDITTNIRGHGHIELDSTGSFGSPKIKLFSNTGNAEFAGTVTTGGTINAANTSAAGNAIIIGNSNQIVLQANGSASFTSGVKMFRTAGDSSTRINIGESDTLAVWQNDGNFSIGYDGTARFGATSVGHTDLNKNSVSIYPEQNAPAATPIISSYDSTWSTPTFQLTASGSGTFRGDQSIENSSYIRVRKAGDNTSTAIQLAPDGSASFAGDVQVADTKIRLVTSSNNGLIRVLNSSLVDTIFLAGSDGSATFGTGYKVKIRPYDGDSANQFWTQKTNGTISSYITGAGSASFAGTVSAQGSVLTSDQRFKENITDANPQLADVTALGNKLRNWDWTADAPVADKDTRFLGLVAQEAETVCPGIVTTIARTKDGAELTPEVVVPAVYETRTVPAVLDEEGEVVEAETTEQVLVTEEQVTPATYEQLDDSYKGIKNDILIMKLLGAVAELSAKVAALEAG